MKITRAFLTVVLVSAGLLGAAKAKDKEQAGAYESKGSVHVVGETIHVLGTRSEAEIQAMKDAAARLALFLEQKGYGKKKDIVVGVENAVLKETDLKTYKLGKVRVDSVLQERWEAPDGKEAWSVKVKLTLRRS